MDHNRRTWLGLVGASLAERAAAFFPEVPRGRRLVPLLSGHRTWVTSIAYSRDGRHLASSSGRFDRGISEGDVKLWDPVTGDLRNLLGAFRKPVGGVSFSPDGKTLASCRRGQPGGVDLWDVATGKLRESLRGPGERGDVTAVCFSPDGKALAVDTWGDGTFVLTPSGKQLAAFNGGFKSSPFSPDGKLLSSGEVLFNVEGKVVRRLEGKPEVCAHTFSADGKTLVTGHDEGGVRLWDVATGKQTASLTGEQELSIHCVTASPDGKWMVTASNEINVGVWDLKERKRRHLLESPTRSPVDAVAFRPDSKLFLTGDRSGSVIPFDPVTGKQLEFPLPPQK